MNYSFPNIVPFKISFKADPRYKHLFDQSLCSLTISVGQDNHEGNKFLSTLHQINKNFKACIIAVCDTLQRHTLSIHYKSSSDELYTIAKQQGCNWLIRNKSAIELLTIPYKIIRWSEWLHSPLYQSKRVIIDALYESNKNYRSSIIKAVELFLGRYSHREPVLNYEQAFNYSLEYLKEECAVMLLWVDLGINFEIYPSKRNLAMAATYDHLIAPIYKNILIPVALDIRSRKIQQIRYNSFQEAIVT